MPRPDEENEPLARMVTADVLAALPIAAEVVMLPASGRGWRRFAEEMLQRLHYVHEPHRKRRLVQRKHPEIISVLPPDTRISIVAQAISLP